MRFNKNIKISDFIISEESRTFIIAEAGVNHNGELKLALQLVDIAKEAGADAVKFQMFKTENLILANVEKAPYQRITERKSKNQFEMLKSLELSPEEHRKIYEYCKKKGIIYLCTPYDEESLENLVNLGVPAIKVASTDTTNLLFLEKIAKKGLPVILSSGMSNLFEIEIALRTLYNNGLKDVILLQCTSNYPVTPEEVNLKAIISLRKIFNIIVGFSDHTKGIGAAPYSIMFGAKVIEKHFTINKNMEGPDHRASLSPEELKSLVDEIRFAEKIVGNGLKSVTYSEQTTKKFLQKHLVARKKIKKGEIIKKESLIAKRTGGRGISPIFIDMVINRKASRDIEIDEILDFNNIE